MSSRRSDAVDPPSKHAVLTVEMLTQGEACRRDGTMARCRSEGGVRNRAGSRAHSTAVAGVGEAFRHGRMAVVTQPCCSAGGRERIHDVAHYRACLITAVAGDGANRHGRIAVDTQPSGRALTSTPAHSISGQRMVKLTRSHATMPSALRQRAWWT